MRICLDVTPLVQPVMTGVQIVTRDVVLRLIQDFPNEAWVLFSFVPQKSYARFTTFWQNIDSKVEKKFIKIPSKLFHLGLPMWQRCGWPYVETFVGSIDHYHSFEWFHFPSRSRSSATIQDWSPMIHPEWYQKENVDVFKRRWRAIQNSADVIIPVSTFLNDEIVGDYPQISNQLVTIPNGIPIDSNIVSKKESLPVLTKFGLLNGYFLAVGTVGYRKNYDTLLAAYDIYRRSTDTPKSLVIVSQLGTTLESQPGLQVLSELNREELNAVYSQAEALFFPSWYEAFGLPMLEAMHCGIPVIASDIPTAHEIGGSLFRYVDASNTHAWVLEMQRFDTATKKEKEALRKQLINGSHAFSLERIASLYHSLFTSRVSS